MRIKNLSKVYKTRYEDVTALENISLILPTKGLVFIVGVSGSGKTTLMNMLSRVDEPTDGNIYIGNKELFSDSKKVKKEMYGYRNSYVGLIFQDYNLIEDLNVYDNIKLSLDLMGRRDYEIVDEVIKKIDIEDIKYANVNEISSGQMQRVAIARALVKGSSIILADEPTGNLDSKNEKIVFDILKEISKDRLVVVITHDGEAALEYGDRIIEIEDGKVVSDSSPLSKVENEETPEFIEPKLTLRQQLKFTFNFIRTNFTRSISLFLILLLVPIIGGILSGYVRYDVSVGYRRFQDKYGSDFITLSQSKGGFDIYYDPEQVVELYNKYPKSDLIEYYDIYLDINKKDKEEDFFFKPVITNAVIYNDIFPLEGFIPSKNTEIIVTDYVLESIKYYQDVEEVKKITFDGIVYTIVGVIDTDYEKFIDANFDDEYLNMAFNENLTVYNAIYTTYSGYAYMINHTNSYHEVVRFIVYSPIHPPKTKFEDVMVYRQGSKDIDLIYGTSNLSYRTGLVSSAFLKEALELSPYDLSGGDSLSLFCYSKANYQIRFRIVGVFESDEYEVIVDDEQFTNNLKKITHSRFLISKDDPCYQQIVNNENVTNESFYYADAMRTKAKDAYITMLESLILLIFIIITFSTIINMTTVNAEKKKIGIKYSFGLKKLSIVVPYILEYLIYIIIGFVISSVIVKWGFIYFMKNVIYTVEEDIKIFDFFYISWSTIIGWDLIIYSLMVISLSIMVLNICRKSPIEIIKNL